jgi:hypothetical protein
MGTVEAKDILGSARKASTDESTASTSVMEQTEPATLDIDEKKKDAMDWPVTVEKTEADLDRTVSNLSQEPEEYPGSVKLTLVTVALCLSVFCMALVWHMVPAFLQASRH